MRILRFFDRLEDKIRYSLSRRPILYSLVGGVAIVLFWRGVWMTADYFEFMTGPVSLLASIAILLFIGLFVSFFIGDQILITGMKHEKKLTEKTEEEVKAEEITLLQIHNYLNNIFQKIESIEQKIEKQ